MPDNPIPEFLRDTMNNIAQLVEEYLERNGRPRRQVRRDERHAAEELVRALRLHLSRLPGRVNATLAESVLGQDLAAAAELIERKLIGGER